MFLHSIDLETATKIVDAAIAKGHEMGFLPLTVVVLDDSGTMKAMKREDGALSRSAAASSLSWSARSEGISFQAAMCCVWAPHRWIIPPWG